MHAGWIRRGLKNWEQVCVCQEAYECHLHLSHWHPFDEEDCGDVVVLPVGEHPLGLAVEQED